ncbi:MAG: ribonuclease P protein component [Mycoplasmatales bacterium]
MKKQYVLKDKILFNKVIQKGKKVKNKYYVIYFLPNFELKIGITIGKKLGNAPMRNYYKRVIRSICRNNFEQIPQLNIVIIGREELKNTTYEEQNIAFINLIERIKNEK